MSKLKTVYGVYFLNYERTEGLSHFFDTSAQAHEMTQGIAPGWYVRRTEQTYDLEENIDHDCGDED
jgi:hypothetical protein